MDSTRSEDNDAPLALRAFEIAGPGLALSPRPMCAVMASHADAGGRARGTLRLLGPGMLVAATGVGAGDLATGAFTGSTLGTAVLWAVLAGAGLKFVLNEGLARWQLATGETLLEGALGRLPRPLRLMFFVYLFPWSFFVGSALIAACGVTAHAIAPVFGTPERGKLVFGVLHSLLGLALVLRGGFRLFERVMSAAIALMFVTVIVTAVLLRPDVGALLRGLFVPRIPDAGGEGLAWTVALIGGVGGTLTILCYGYWIREAGREGAGALRLCRIDLASGYAMTAAFGLAMVTIGSTIEIEGRGAGLVVALADALEERLGSAARWCFLAAARGAVGASLLGVWQAVPYLFADAWRLVRAPRGAAAQQRVSTSSLPYRAYLVALALVPLAGLRFGFKSVQLAYATIGAGFLPLLAIALLVLNGRRAWVGELRNRPLTVLALGLTVVFFGVAGWLGLVD